MLERGRSFLIEAGVAADQIVRLDVPGRGGGEDGDGPLRTDLEPLIPMLQSGSLFGDKQGVMIVEAQNLNAAETELLSQLLAGADDDSVAVSVVAFGSFAASLSKLIKAIGEVVTVRKMWERQAGDWLGNEVRHLIWFSKEMPARPCYNGSVPIPPPWGRPWINSRSIEAR